MSDFEFESMTVPQLKTVIRTYNLHMIIKGYSRMKKDDLIRNIKTHVTIRDNKITPTKIQDIDIDILIKKKELLIKKKELLIKKRDAAIIEKKEEDVVIKKLYKAQINNNNRDEIKKMTGNLTKLAAVPQSKRIAEIYSKLLLYKYSLEHLPFGDISNEYKILIDEAVQLDLLRYKVIYPSLNSNQLLLNDLKEYLTKQNISRIQPAMTEKEIEIHNKRIKYIIEKKEEDVVIKKLSKAQIKKNNSDELKK